MRILIDARMYGLENAGIGRYLINLIKELQNLPSDFEYSLLLRKKYYESLKLGKKWKKVLADFRHYTFKEQLLLPGIINKEKPDLVHFPHLNIPLLWNGKFIATVHDLTMQRQKTDATTLPLPVYYLKRLPFLLTAKKTVTNSARIIAPSNFVKDDIVSYYGIKPGKVSVSYEGFSELKINKNPDLTLKKYGIKKPYFVYVGNAYPHKNLEVAIKAIVLLNKSVKNKVFLALGGSRGIFRERLTRQIENINAKDYVKLLGFVEDADLGDIYKQSLGLVYPSFTEGYGLQGLEAMNAGTPVLSSDIPVFREIYGRQAIYFDPRNEKDLSDKMKNILNFKNKERLELILESQKYVKKYSWRKMAEDTLTNYKEILQ